MEIKRQYIHKPSGKLSRQFKRIRVLQPTDINNNKKLISIISEYYYYSFSLLSLSDSTSQLLACEPSNFSCKCLQGSLSKFRVHLCNQSDCEFASHWVMPMVFTTLCRMLQHLVGFNRISENPLIKIAV